MKKLFLVIVFIVFVIGIVALVLIRNNDNRRLEITTIIDSMDNYRCDVNIEDENIVKYDKEYSLNEKENLDDEKTHINFVFEGLSAGRTTVTIKCVDTISNEVLKEEIHKIMVNRKLETSIYVLEK